jgi:ElaB/YqjD/DUF883 family membrane-anchored ribosome-binding protein
MDAATTEQLMAELRTVARHAEELLQAIANQGGARLEEAGDSAREAAREIDQQVRNSPWAAIAIAAGAGLLLGLLLGRK